MTFKRTETTPKQKRRPNDLSKEMEAKVVRDIFDHKSRFFGFTINNLHSSM